MKFLSRFLLLMLVIAATSIAHAQNRYKYVQTGPQTYAAIDEKQVTVINDGSQPPLDATEVGIINYTTEEERQLWKKAKLLAAEHGCNYVFAEAKYKLNRYFDNKGTLHLYMLTAESAAKIIPPPSLPVFERGDKVIYMGAREHPATIIAKKDDEHYVVRIDDEGATKVIPAIKLRKIKPGSSTEQIENAEKPNDSTRSVVCLLKVLQIVKSCAIAKDFPKGSKIAVGSYNPKKQYCTISVYIEDNGLLTSLHAMIFYPATKELFEMGDGKTSVAYDHALDAEATKYCW